MTKISYTEKRFAASSLAVIEKANEIIADYRAQGFDLTLRQLYYQFVARALLPNKQTEYKRLGSIINDARLAGLIDWEAIEDRTRNLQKRSHWTSPEEIIRGCVEQFHVDLWRGQDYRPEVWIEKEALVGVISDVCHELDVPYFACRGYTSQSEMWRAGQRALRYSNEGQIPVVIHLGDHDPSGVDMTRDTRDRFALFAGSVDVLRVALNMDQVEEYGPPPNPAKFTDSRCEGYVARYGRSSWELDALEPRVIVETIRATVESKMDREKFDRRVRRRNQHRDEIQRVANQWADVVEFVEE